jgi:hypothetical protein
MIGSLLEPVNDPVGELGADDDIMRMTRNTNGLVENTSGRLDERFFSHTQHFNI